MEKIVTVTQQIEVTIDESKFDESFMQEFRDSYFNFNTVDEHIKHLAQMYARGLYTNPNDFIEGYGYMDEMGIRFQTFTCEEEINK